MPLVSFADVVAELEDVDDPDVLARAESSAATRHALEMARPRNWWGSGIEAGALFDIARSDGIPVAWVPRRDILVELAAAQSQRARRRVLVDCNEAIARDCMGILADCDDDWVADYCVLGRAAVSAYLAGHHEAAMALAVSIAEPLALWASEPRVQVFESKAEQAAWEAKRRKSPYKLAETVLTGLDLDIRPYLFRYLVLIAPIPRFFTSWRPEWNTPPPSSLSRHVVAHQPTRAHFSASNALVALMLASSLLREYQGWAEEVRSMEYEGF